MRVSKDELQQGCSHGPSFPRRVSRPSLAKPFAPLTSEGAGNAGRQCTRSLACKMKSTRVSHHRFTGQRRHSLRNGFNGLLRALPGDRAFLSPSPRNAKHCRKLTPASRCQDHTASPSAAPIARHATSQRPLLPAPRSWRSRAAPLGGTGWGEGIQMICPTAQGEILVRYLGRLRRLHRDEIKGSHCK